MEVSEKTTEGEVPPEIPKDNNNNEVSLEKLKDGNNNEVSTETTKCSTEVSAERPADNNTDDTEKLKDDNNNDTVKAMDSNDNVTGQLNETTNKVENTIQPSSEQISDLPKVPVLEPVKTETESKDKTEEKKEEECLKSKQNKEPENTKENTNDLLGNDFDSKWDHFPTSQEFKSLYGDEIWEQLQGSYNDLSKSIKEGVTKFQDSPHEKKEKRLTCWDVLENNIDQDIGSPTAKKPRESQIPSEKEEKRTGRVGRPPGKKNGEVRDNRAPGKIKCHLCENSFDSIAQARAHLLIHSGIKPFKCSKCEYRSYSRFNVTNNHWSNKHDRKGDVNDVDVDEPEKEKMKDFVIKESERMLSGVGKDEEPRRKEKVEQQPEVIKEKAEYIAKPERKNKAKKDGPVKCHLCDKTFELIILAKGHLQVHSLIKPYKCSHCDYNSYSKNNVMNNHCSNHHGKKGTNDDVETDLNEKLNLKQFVIEESEKMLQNNGGSVKEKSSKSEQKGDENNNSGEEN